MSSRYLDCKHVTSFMDTHQITKFKDKMSSRCYVCLMLTLT